MVVLNRIYTRTGDEGTTSLGNGESRKKYDLRVDAYGTLDEVNAAIGVARLHTGGGARLDAAVSRAQKRLFQRRGGSLPAAKRGGRPAHDGHRRASKLDRKRDRRNERRSRAVAL